MRIWSAQEVVRAALLLVRLRSCWSVGNGRECERGYRNERRRLVVEGRKGRGVRWETDTDRDRAVCMKREVWWWRVRGSWWYWWLSL